MKNIRLVTSIMAVLAIFLYSGVSMSYDPPHHAENGVPCGSCHTFKDAVGPSSTKDANENLCISCHVGAGNAAAKPFAASDEGVSSHTWGNGITTDSSLPLADDPNNRRGLRSTTSFTNASLKRFVEKFGDCSVPAYVTKASCEGAAQVWTPKVTCSGCHNVHSHASEPWRPDVGVSSKSTGGSPNTLIDTTQSWSVNSLVGKYIRIADSAPRALRASYRAIASNTSNTITVTDNFSAQYPSTPITANISYYIVKDREFMRMTNTANQLCEQCHYYRTLESGQTNVRTYTGNKLSHPIGIKLDNVTNANAFFSVPHEPKDGSGLWETQTTAPRYTGNGGSDTNSSNNMILDSSSKIRCMTCHNVHYADSNAYTVDAP